MLSRGSWSMIARATVSPPTPLSKTPIGASVTVTSVPTPSDDDGTGHRGGAGRPPGAIRASRVAPG
jgi:hypothetical protein